jgi:hypothetical protein
MPAKSFSSTTTLACFFFASMIRHLFSIDINSTGAGLKNSTLENGSLTGDEAQ